MERSCSASTSSFLPPHGPSLGSGAGGGRVTEGARGNFGSVRKQLESGHNTALPTHGCVVQRVLVTPLPTVVGVECARPVISRRRQQLSTLDCHTCPRF